VATTAQRQHVLAVLDFFHAHATHLLYPPGDQRSWRDSQSWGWSEQTTEHTLQAGGYWQGDCSEFCSYVLKCCGIWKWSSPGYTGSHLQLLPVYTDARGALTGALVVFGPGTGDHEAVVHTPDPEHGDPILSSHGRPGFDAVRLSAMAAEFERMGKPGVRFLSIAHL
jgi:hypothetical protein